jgi:hypothetical protein
VDSRAIIPREWIPHLLLGPILEAQLEINNLRAQLEIKGEIQEWRKLRMKVEKKQRGLLRIIVSRHHDTHHLI